MSTTLWIILGVYVVTFFISLHAVFINELEASSVVYRAIDLSDIMTSLFLGVLGALFNPLPLLYFYGWLPITNYLDKRDKERSREPWYVRAVRRIGADV